MKMIVMVVPPLLKTVPSSDPSNHWFMQTTICSFYCLAKSLDKGFSGAVSVGNETIQFDIK